MADPIEEDPSMKDDKMKPARTLRQRLRYIRQRLTDIREERTVLLAERDELRRALEAEMGAGAEADEAAEG